MSGHVFKLDDVPDEITSACLFLDWKDNAHLQEKWGRGMEQKVKEGHHFLTAEA